MICGWSSLWLGTSLFLIADALDSNVQERVKMFTFQRGFWLTPSTEHYLRYDFMDNRILTGYTLCYRMRVESFTKTAPHFSYSTDKTNTNALMFESEGSNFNLFYNGKALPSTYLKRLEIFPETWNHFCHVVENSVYKLYWQGKEFIQAQISGAALPLNGTLIIGQEQDEVGGGFTIYEVVRGDVTQFSIWDYSLMPHQIENLVNCISIGSGNIFSLDSNQVQTFGNVKEVKIELLDLCRTLPPYVIITDVLPWTHAFTKCSLIGGEMAVPKNDHESNHLRESLDPFIGYCNATLWLMWMGMTDEKEEGIFINANSQQPLQYTKVDPGSNGGDTLNCMSVLSNGFWASANCDYEKCSACHVSRSSYLYLRGLCFKGEHNMRFRVAGYSGGRILFRGYHDYVIVWNQFGEKWQILNTNDNTTVAYTKEKKYPLGRKSWVISQTTCDYAEGDIANLSLSCRQDQFMCSSGACIQQHLRCDLSYDCNDGSDEDECQVVIVKKGYRIYLPPRGGGRSPLQITPVITLNRINEVDDIDKVIDVELSVKLTWSDAQLNFKHLNPKEETLLTNYGIEKIWLPRYQLVNVKGGKAQEQSTSVAVVTAENATTPDHNSVDMDMIYPGINNSMSITRQHIERFTCEFKLYAYPFDIQRCSILIRLRPSYNGKIHFQHKEGKVVYTGPKQLTLYNIYHPEYVATNDSSLLRVKFRLHRRQGFIILSTFLPSILLLAVSWATLFVRIQDLNVRAVLSLTTLLVLFTLFSNTSRTLPTTATIKLIDMWFTFIIVLLFSNIIVHIFVVREPEMPIMMVKTAPEIKVKKKGFRLRISLPFRFLVVYRLFIIPIIVIVFLVVFISICAYSSS